MSLTTTEREIADEVILETFLNADITPENLRQLVSQSLDFIAKVEYKDKDETEAYGQVYTLLSFLKHTIKDL